jgi:replicative DNA helicase
MAERGPTERVPYDLTAELAVLGSVLRDPRCLPEVSAHLVPDDFYAPRHRRLFQLMEDMERRSAGHCDAVSVAHEQERQGLAEELGGPAYLQEAALTVPSIAFLENHVRIVRDLAIRRALLDAAAEVQRLVHSPEEDEIGAVVERAETVLYRVGDRLVSRNAESMRELVDRQLAQLLGGAGQEQGLQTTFLDLDEKHGFRPGDLIVLAARPGMGKTALALNLLERVALKEGKSVLMFSLEMPCDQLVMRLLSTHARIPHENLRRGRLTPEDKRRITLSGSALRDARVHIDESSQPTLAEIRAKARRLRRDGAVDLIIVDYLQLLQARAESRQNEIALISRTLKSIARDLKVPLLALAQLNRKAEERTDHRPMLADLRESGAIEQDADLVLLLMREELYGETDDNRDKAQVFVAKNRHGPTGEFTLRFDKRYMRFENFVNTGRERSAPPPAAPASATAFE